MTEYKSDLLTTLAQRGFIHQCTDEAGLDARLDGGRIGAYIGFDCTAPSLHVGSLIQIMVLRHLQKCGHKPVILLGGGTTRVGDPSGRDESRKLLTDADIQRNLGGIRATLERFLQFGSGPTDAILVDNAEWLDQLNYIAFLRDVGRHFSVNRMLTQESVKARLEREQNLSFLEFNYMILQAYDFVELHRRHGCLLQIGGSDQWGNIIMGIELHRRLQAEQGFRPMRLPGESEANGEASVARVVEVQPFIRSSGHTPETYTSEHFIKRLESEKDHLFGLTTPLLTTHSGAKMGKTAAGAIWLDGEMLSPYEYWQFWRNAEDADTVRFLKLFTELPLAEIEKLAQLKGSEVNEAKKILATEATRLAHGDKAAKQAADTARKTFEEGESGEVLPEYKLPAGEFGKGLPVYELFRLSGLTGSGGEAKRLIRGGGARVADRKVEDENRLITLADFGEDESLKLSAGRKKHLIVKLK